MMTTVALPISRDAYGALLIILGETLILATQRILARLT